MERNKGVRKNESIVWEIILGQYTEIDYIVCSDPFLCFVTVYESVTWVLVFRVSPLTTVDRYDNEKEKKDFGGRRRERTG